MDIQRKDSYMLPNLLQVLSTKIRIAKILTTKTSAHFTGDAVNCCQYSQHSELNSDTLTDLFS
jgi:hypothetical protein